MTDARPPLPAAPAPESSAADYLAWRDTKVRRVLDAKTASEVLYKPLAEIVRRNRRGES